MKVQPSKQFKLRCFSTLSKSIITCSYTTIIILYLQSSIHSLVFIIPISNMQIEGQRRLYQPVAFVYTETVGGTQNQQENSTYIWKFRDILPPKPLIPQYVHFYYLFHVAPIYNWIRSIQHYCYELEQLKKYIGSPISQPSSKKQRVQLPSIQQRLISYSKKWEIVKLCLFNRIFITNSSKCKHMLKTQQWTNHFSYDFKKQDFTASQVFCKECQMIIEVSAELQDQAYAPIFPKYYGKSLITKKGTYHLVIAYTNQQIYIKGANQIFNMMEYGSEGNQIKMKLTNQIKLDKIKNGLFCYLHESVWQGCGLLKVCVQNEITLNKPQPQETILKQNNEPLQWQEKGEERVKPESQLLKVKKLVSLKKQINPILIEEKQGQTSQYKEKISKLFYKPKEKDEYEREYDKGKTKKIKKKIEYIKPNFNQIHQKVKQQLKDGEDLPSNQQKHQNRRKEVHKKFSERKQFNTWKNFKNKKSKSKPFKGKNLESK